jgi:hypothetical protein
MTTKIYTLKTKLTNEKKKKEKKKGGYDVISIALLALIVLHNTRWGEHKKTTGMDALW